MSVGIGYVGTASAFDGKQSKRAGRPDSGIGINNLVYLAKVVFSISKLLLSSFCLTSDFAGCLFFPLENMTIIETTSTTKTTTNGDHKHTNRDHDQWRP